MVYFCTFLLFDLSYHIRLHTRYTTICHVTHVCNLSISVFFFWHGEDKTFIILFLFPFLTTDIII